MIMISKYQGIPTSLEGGLKQYEDTRREFENHSFWVFGFQHKAYLTLQKVKRGLYKGCYAVYQSATEPQEYIKMCKFE